ncbi:Protein ABHD13 [Astathelohania contejeani]|uniref:Protein ABHD13 n=1 Tax=Astathelohania contejeani TaxID=164912 RepID=A0ABQ7HZG4_9MICR|nr:Protein ABHD13 [Thelohania contejeani]
MKVKPILDIFITFTSWCPFVILYAIFYLFNSHKNYIYPKTNLTEPLKIFTDTIHIKTADNIDQYIYMINNKSSIDIVFFGGNNIDAKWLSETCYNLQNKTRYNVLSIIYRGYNGIEAEPNEIGLMLDTYAIYDYIKQYRKNKRFVCMGLSLGCSLALYLAELLGDDFKKVCILENGFFNMKLKVEESLGNFSWLSFLLTEKYENDKRVIKLKSQNTQFLFITSSNDKNIGNHHSKMLMALLDGNCVHKIFDADHMTACFDKNYFSTIDDFIKKKLNYI